MQATEVAIGELLSLLSGVGYVDRRIDMQDRRQKLIVLTNAGYNVLKESRQIALKINKQILKNVREEELAVAEDVLRHIRANILALDSAS
jgi:DNA-binding MarR family transcriptional regulator